MTCPGPGEQSTDQVRGADRGREDDAGELADALLRARRRPDHARRRGVDTRTEVLVQKEQSALRSCRASFVIAHRLSTSRDADLVLVMEAV